MLQFEHNGEQVTLKVMDTPIQMELAKISVLDLQELMAANEIWAMEVLDPTTEVLVSSDSPDLQAILTEYADVFSKPATLPPHRALDHPITLETTAQPVNSRPYRYSPLQKDEIERYGIISKPLTQFLSKKGFEWNEQADYAFQTLKEAMINTPVLALPNFSIPFVMETDACDTGVGAVLMQKGHPIAYMNEKDYSMEHGIIKWQGRVVIGANLALQTKLIPQLHNTPMGGIQAKHSNTKPAGLLQPLPPPEEPWAEITMDFIEGLPLSEHANIILVVVDRLTKYAHFLALKHPYTASSVAKVYLDNIVKLHGVPLSIISDRDKALYKKEPNFGAFPNISVAEGSAATTDVVDYQMHIDTLRARLLQAQHRMKANADKNRTERQFSIGEQVLLKLQPYAKKSVVNRPYPKLSYKFFGPYVVLERIGEVAYKLQFPSTAKVHPVFHVSQLKPFTPKYTRVFDELPSVPDLAATTIEPEEILERPMVRSGNMVATQVLIKWRGLIREQATWEDYALLKLRVPNAALWDTIGHHIHTEFLNNAPNDGWTPFSWTTREEPPPAGVEACHPLLKKHFFNNRLIANSSKNSGRGSKHQPPGGREYPA
ncbi:uncharacterized protein [Lolium perenne]|uniref:uncharacterized protein n=1 Tax=Lolium perenne TaxID=4522 RepID=UPI003A99C65C